MKAFWEVQSVIPIKLLMEKPQHWHFCDSGRLEIHFLISFQNTKVPNVFISPFTLFVNHLPKSMSLVISN